MPRRRDIAMKTLQGADQLLGLVVCSLLQPLRWLRVPNALGGRGHSHREVERVLLIKFWGIGSLQLLTPAARSLRRRRPQARLTLLTLAENADFARGLGVFDEVKTLDVRGAGWLGVFVRIAALVSLLRGERFDEVYDFEFFTRFSAVISILSGAPTRAGFQSPSVWRGRLHTQTTTFNRYWHVARNFRALAGGEDGHEVAHEDLVPFAVPGSVRQRLAGFLAERGAVREPLVVLNPNAGSLSLERRWPRDRFAQLAQTLIRESGAQVVLIGAPSEARYTGEIVQLAGLAEDESAGLLDLSGGLDIAELCALLERADVVVSNDSGPMHIAAVLGTPTIGLFGPETPVMYRPLGPRARALWDPPICSPCINVHDNKLSNCIHGQPECLMNLSTESVLGTTRRFLEGEVLHPVAPPAEVTPAKPKTHEHRG
jgi:lipopolysaccharide heptosyltransferase II